MEINPSMPKVPTYLNILIRKKLNMCNRSLENYYSMPEILNPQCYLHLIRYQFSSHNLYKKL